MKKGILTDDKGEVVERAFQALCESGEWAEISKAIATANYPAVIAWKMGFYHAMCAYDTGAIKVVAMKKSDQN